MNLYHWVSAVSSWRRTLGTDGAVHVKLVDQAGTVSAGGYRAMPTVTRPANATPYTAGDVIGGVIEFTNIGPAGGTVVVTAADLMVYVAAVPSGMGSMRLRVYDATPPSALADNAAWDLPSGDRGNYLGFIDIGIPVDEGSTLAVQNEQVNKQFKLASGQTSLWAYLQVGTVGGTGGFTPAGNSEVYVPRLRALGA